MNLLMVVKGLPSLGKSIDQFEMFDATCNFRAEIEVVTFMCSN